MRKYCTSETNIIYERYLFINRSQEASESIDTYATTLCTKAASCEFGALHDDLIRDRIVCGIRDNSVR